MERNMYHYTDCGLPNVWLQNGFHVVMTPYGEGVSIEDADTLHQVLALDLTRKSGGVTGAEFRFMRTMLGLSQQSLALMLGFTEQAVSLWERKGKVPTAPDAALRMLVAEQLNGNAKMREMLERINTVDRLVNQHIIATERARMWKTKTQADVPEWTTA